MWISKPIYEGLPYLYIVLGSASLIGSMYLDYWYWPSIGFGVGIIGLVAGLVVLLRRRDHRDTDKNAKKKEF